MLYLVGIGLQPEHLTLEARRALEVCSQLYLESYTSAYAKGSVEFVETLLGKKVRVADRTRVEDGFSEVLEEARSQNIALLVFGNPLSATTHVQLLLDAKEKKVDFRVVPGISIFSYLGFTGLEEYKFGRTTTVVRPEKNFAPESFYDAVVENHQRGLHTLCLLDIRENGEMMSAKEAVGILEKIEEKRKTRSVIKSAVLLAIAGAGGDKMAIKWGDAAEIARATLRERPQSLVVCGALCEKEKEALDALWGKKGGRK